MAAITTATTFAGTVRGGMTDEITFTGNVTAATIVNSGTTPLHYAVGDHTPEPPTTPSAAPGLGGSGQPVPNTVGTVRLNGGASSGSVAFPVFLGGRRQKVVRITTEDVAGASYTVTAA